MRLRYCLGGFGGGIVLRRKELPLASPVAAPPLSEQVETPEPCPRQPLLHAIPLWTSRSRHAAAAPCPAAAPDTYTSQITATRGTPPVSPTTHLTLTVTP